MTQPQQVQSHPASVDAYIRHGWSLVPIPPGTKGPRHEGWNQRIANLRSQSDLPQGWGIGLAHAYSGTMALDIDEWHKAEVELAAHGVNIREMYEASDAVIVDSGKQGHGKLLYAMPFGLTLPSKKVVRDGVTVYELRCATSNGLTVQDVMPPSMHPQTQQPYRWAGRGHWTRLPVLPQPVLDLWQSLLETEKRIPKATESSASWEDIAAALGHIDANCDRKQWIDVGMALHAAGVQTDDLDHALTLWNEWSKQSEGKYPGERDILTQWKSFRDDKGVTITLGTLFHIARQNGWVKPAPDISKMFSATDSIPTDPDVIVQDLTISPPDLDLDLFPEVLRTRAQEISEHMGCDALVPLFSGLIAVCGAVDARTRLELMPGFQVPPVLWCMSVGDPGDKKTPGSAPMFDILRQLEVEDAPRFARAALEFEVSEVRYTAAKKANLDMQVTPEALLSGTIDVTGIGTAPNKPVPVRILVNDITSQALVRHCADRPRGVLCYMDEMAAWARKLSDPRTIENKSAWTVAYECKRYQMDRVGSGTITAENYAVSIYGNIQPKVFNEYLASLSEDGMIQRFIPIPLRANQRRLGHPVPAFMTNAAAYDQMIRMVYGMPAITYRLSNEAYELFREFQETYERQMADERLLKSTDTYLTALGKIEGLTGRIALVLHIMESPYDTHISADLMHRAIRIMRSYIIPVYRFTYNPPNFTKFDKWVTEYVVQYCDQETMTIAQIKRSARRQIEKVPTWTATQMILGAMVPLEESKWVIRIDDGEGDHKDKAHWAINPLLKDSFKAYRLAVIAAKQRVAGDIYDEGPQAARERAMRKVKGAELLKENQQ